MPYNQVMTPHRSELQESSYGFAELLHAEWTKFRTVRGWVIGLLAASLVMVLLGWLTASGSKCFIGPHPGQASVEGCDLIPAVGPGGLFVTDNFNFVRQPLDGNGSMTVRMTSLTGLYNPNTTGHGSRGDQNPLAGMKPGLQPWSKAGIIVKDGTRPGAAYAAMMVTGGHGVRMQWDYTQDTPGRAGPVSAASPRWLRLTRDGDIITGFDSADGIHWAKVGVATLAGLPSTVQVGLFATSPSFQTLTQSIGQSGAIGTPTLATGAFDHVSLPEPEPGHAWTAGVIKSADSFALPPALQTFHQGGGRFTVSGSGDIAPADVGAGIGNTLTGTFAGLIAVVIVGALFMATEYRRGLIRVTFAARPRRGQVLAAKVIVLGAVAFAAGLAAVAITIPLGVRLLRDSGNPIYPVSTLTGLRVIAGTAALLALAAVLALAAGTILRHSAGAVAFGIVVIFLPYLLGTVPGVLPAGAQEWLLRLTPAAAFAVQQIVPPYPQVIATYLPTSGYFPLAPWAGLAVLAGYAALALILAAFLLRRRDA